jgi:hypothetical protein
LGSPGFTSRVRVALRCFAREEPFGRFESTDQVHKIDKTTFKAEKPNLRESLLDVQFDLAERRDFAVLILPAPSARPEAKQLSIGMAGRLLP